MWRAGKRSHGWLITVTPEHIATRVASVSVPEAKGLHSRDHIMNGNNRKDIRPGVRVHITQKQDQRTGKLTGGIVKDILTKSAFTHAALRSAPNRGSGTRAEIVETGQEVTGRG